MTLTILLLLAVIFVAYSNGSNDNFKGVATLYGSGILSYRSTLLWATITTFSGSLCAIYLSQGLIKSFSAKGLFSVSTALPIEFFIAVAFGTAITVFLATLTGFPISTTHALIGGLTGAGVVMAGQEIKLSALLHNFLTPLLLSPFIAVAMGGVLYFCLNHLRQYLKVTKELSSSTEKEETLPQRKSFVLRKMEEWEFSTDTKNRSVMKYQGKFMEIPLHALIDIGHFLSAGAVSFARGLNDTPKIFALLLVIQGENFSPSFLLMIIAIAMATGGIINARKVAETMSQKITKIETGQGFTTNISTAAIVFGASLLGSPVSTTHVTCGTLFGMGIVTRQANIRVIREILLSWLLTLPISAFFAAGIYFLLTL